MYVILGSLPTSTIAFILLIAAGTAFFQIRYNRSDLTYGPVILTMFGILGCFTGIALGLFQFDTNDIQKSVPDLPSGIKTSFWASIAGVVGALTIKARCLLFGPPRLKGDKGFQGTTTDDLAWLLRSLQQSIAAKEDSTLLSQAKLLRQEMGDGLKLLNSTLENYMEKMADNNSKALIEALKEMIRDFNAKINEQFGDNFKQLNSAVERILVWQDAYRQQMTEMIDQQRTTTENMSVAVTRYSELVQQAQKFSSTATALQALLTALESQREHLHGALTHLGNLLKAASDGVPRLEEKIIELTRQIEASVRSTSDKLAAASKEFTRNVQDSHSEMQRILTQSVTDVHREVNSHLQQLSAQTKEQVVTLDRALSEELTRSIRTLGEHLTSLSHKFVDDYTPLTERLRSLVQSAGAV
jgi:DNA anti-recombination protein RmuC